MGKARMEISKNEACVEMPPEACYFPCMQNCQLDKLRSSERRELS